MGGENPGSPEAGKAEAARPRTPGRFQTGMRGLIVAVACCGVVAWAGRSLWEGQHPAIEAARGLRSSNTADRAGAARQLIAAGTSDPDRAIPPLVAALGDAEPEVRVAAADALAAIINQVAPTGSSGDAVRAGLAGLVGALKDRDPVVRIAAANAFPRIAGAKGAAGVIDLRPVIDAIAARIGDPDDRVRQAAFLALWACGPVTPSGPPAALISAMEDRSAGIRGSAIGALSRFPCPLDPWLATLLRGVEHDPEVRQSCRMAFTRDQPPAFSAEAIPALVAALGSPSRIVRSYAARALHPHARDGRLAVAIPALLTVLREPIDPDLVRPSQPGQVVAWNGWDPSVLAADLLGRLTPGTKSADSVIAALTEVVRSGHESRRAPAAFALGAFGPAAEPAVPALIGALREDLGRAGPEVPFWYGHAAARALGRIAQGTSSADEALSALIEALDPGRKVDLDMRLAVIETLPAYGARAARALPRLRDLRMDRNPRLKSAVEVSVGAIERAGAEVKDGNSSR